MNKKFILILFCLIILFYVSFLHGELPCAARHSQSIPSHVPLMRFPLGSEPRLRPDPSPIDIT